MHDSSPYYYPMNVLLAGLSLAVFSQSVFSESLRWTADAEANRSGFSGSFIPGISSITADGRPMWNLPLWAEDVPVLRNGNIAATKTLYLGQLSVGTPPRTFTMVFDTGSGNTVLPHVECKALACLTKQLYNSSASSSATSVRDARLSKFGVLGNEQVQIVYGGGHVTGRFLRDFVCAGEGQCVELNLVVASDMAKNPFAFFTFDGLLGLSLEELALASGFSFVHQVLTQHPQMHKQFSIMLAQDGHQSLFTLGGYNKDMMASDLQWAPVAMPEMGFWQLSLGSVIVGGSAIDYCMDGGCRVIVDLGASLMGVPARVFPVFRRMMMKKVPKDLYVDDFDCIEFVNMSIEFEMHGFSIVLPPSESMLRKPANLSYKNGMWDMFCEPRIKPVSIPEATGRQLFVWGHGMLRTYYTVFDWGNKYVGFAEMNRNAVPHHEFSRTTAPPIEAPSPGSIDYYIPHLEGPQALNSEGRAGIPSQVQV